MDTKKVPTVHRNLRADGGLGKILVSYSPPPTTIIPGYKVVLSHI